jgi:hypothetical protein
VFDVVSVTGGCVVDGEHTAVVGVAFADVTWVDGGVDSVSSDCNDDGEDIENCCEKRLLGDIPVSNIHASNFFKHKINTLPNLSQTKTV